MFTLALFWMIYTRKKMDKIMKELGEQYEQLTDEEKKEYEEWATNYFA